MSAYPYGNSRLQASKKHMASQGIKLACVRSFERIKPPTYITSFVPDLEYAVQYHI